MMHYINTTFTIFEINRHLDEVTIEIESLTPIEKSSWQDYLHYSWYIHIFTHFCLVCPHNQNIRIASFFSRDLLLTNVIEADKVGVFQSGCSFLLLLCSRWYIYAHIMPRSPYSFVCTLHHIFSNGNIQKSNHYNTNLQICVVVITFLDISIAIAVRLMAKNSTADK